MLLNMDASMFQGDVRVIRCTLKVMVPIKWLRLRVKVLDSLISLFSYDKTIMLLAKVSHTTRKLFTTLDAIV